MSKFRKFYRTVKKMSRIEIFKNRIEMFAQEKTIDVLFSIALYPQYLILFSSTS